MIAEAVSALFSGWGPKNATMENPSFSLNDPTGYKITVSEER